MHMDLLLQVIFVDADQIVRTDMAELYDMDIQGKPLAYTPFCDNNKDMDGFRFWNQVLRHDMYIPLYKKFCIPFSSPVSIRVVNENEALSS